MRETKADRKLKNFDNKVVDAYCTLHFEKSFEEKLEDVKRQWIDKLEEQMLAEQETCDGGGS